VGGDDRAEILVAHQGDHNIVIFDQFGNRVFGVNGRGDFPADFQGGNSLAVALTGLLALSVSQSIRANLITNGGFEKGDFTGWTQSGNTDFIA
jgi:hypothetical protein